MRPCDRGLKIEAPSWQERCQRIREADVMMIDDKITLEVEHPVTRLGARRRGNDDHLG